MEHATKLVVIASMAAAIALETLVTAGVWPALLPITAAAFIGAVVISVAFDEVCAAVVLVFAYVMPALVLTVHGNLLLYYGHVWSAALLGVTIPRSVRAGWGIPARWAAPLVLWALVIALTWPVVALRELDFTPGLLNITHLANTALGGPPPLAAAGIADNTLVLGLGILWFDWLFLAFADDERGFRRFIIVANVVSWTMAVAVSIYQLFGNMLFLNGGLYGAMGRASGTMLDANPFGVTAAAWGPALVAAAWLTPNIALRALAVCGLAASWLGLWASAARTAFATGCIALAFLVYAAWSTHTHHVSRRTRMLIGTAVALAAAVGVLVVLFLPAATGPLPRLRGMAPGWSTASFAAFFREMWDRNGYGLVATHLIREFPLFGVGIGAFHIIVPDYHFLLRGIYLAPDNAQNWYRHQVVETGLVGSIGWILWLATFGWFMLSTRLPAATRFSATIVKGILVAFAVVSLVGLPTQTIAVSVALWTFAFWFVLLASGPNRSASPPQQTRLGFSTWVAVGVVTASAVGGTVYTARDGLRVPQRATTLGFEYFYGFSDPEPAL